MNLSDFDYNLPPELIAIEPVEPRDSARLLVLGKNSGAIAHKYFFDIIDYLQPGDLLVLNNSKVIPARLIGKKATGGAVEILLSKNLGEDWECLIKGKVKKGDKIILSKKLFGIVGARHALPVCVKFNLVGSEFMNEVEKIGQIPLPPYIIKQRRGRACPARGQVRRLADCPYNNQDDKVDYQTVYSDNEKKGSVAAPTAGLHFTPELLNKIKDKGVKIEYVTLHVGLGTFLPVKTEKIADHQIHSEWAEVGPKTIKAIVETKKNGKRVVAVGTTTARTLEFLAKDQVPRTNDQINSKTQGPRGACFAGFVDIFIYPPYKFKIVDALITNFHLPKSTLLMLVSALAGKANIDRAYQEAIKEKYRFYSYGDAMLIF